MKKVEEEYAIQARKGNSFVDVETFNRFNCKWKYPFEDWRKIILNEPCYIPYERRKHGNTVRLVKRTTITEIIKNTP